MTSESEMQDDRPGSLEVLPPVPAQRVTSLPVVQTGALTPMEMISRALAQDASIEVLEKLMSLQERHEKNEARKAFDAAIAAAKAEIPVIVKNRTVDFSSQKGRTHYKHEDLAEIARTVDPILGRHGLSYRYRTLVDGNTVFVTCIMSHRDGHSEETMLPGPRDESGNKNVIQGLGSAVTYLQRYTLKAALGLAASTDDDGGASEGDATRIGEDQRSELLALIQETGTDVDKFCAYMKVNHVGALPAKDFARAKSALEKKRAAP